MLTNYLTALAGMLIISCSWLAVQRLWQRQFPEHDSGDGDALAGRSGCHACDCAPSRCERESDTLSSPSQPSSQQAREAT
jgi:hypothetical protein